MVKWVPEIMDKTNRILRFRAVLAESPLLILDPQKGDTGKEMQVPNYKQSGAPKRNESRRR